MRLIRAAGLRGGCPLSGSSISIFDDLLLVPNIYSEIPMTNSTTIEFFSFLLYELLKLKAPGTVQYLTVKRFNVQDKSVQVFWLLPTTQTLDFYKNSDKVKKKCLVSKYANTCMYAFIL